MLVKLWGWYVHVKVHASCHVLETDLEMDMRIARCRPGGVAKKGGGLDIALDIAGVYTNRSNILIICIDSDFA